MIKEHRVDLLICIAFLFSGILIGAALTVNHYKNQESDMDIKVIELKIPCENER